MGRDPEKARLRSRKSYWKGKGAEYNNVVIDSEIDRYQYRIVPNSWREMAPRIAPRVLQEIKSPIIADLMAGKTIFVDYEVTEPQNIPYRRLYAYFQVRGYRLRIHVCDDVDADLYRRLLMWAEPIKQLRIQKAA